MRQAPRGERQTLRLKERNRGEPRRRGQSSRNGNQEGPKELCCQDGPKDALGGTGYRNAGRLGAHLLGGISAPPAPGRPQQVLLPSSR